MTNCGKLGILSGVASWTNQLSRSAGGNSVTNRGASFGQINCPGVQGVGPALGDPLDPRKVTIRLSAVREAWGSMQSSRVRCFFCVGERCARKDENEARLVSTAPETPVDRVCSVNLQL